MKKYVALLLALCMLCTLVSTGAFAADEETEEYKLFLNRDFEDGTPFDKMSVASKSNIIKGDVEGGDVSGNGFIRFQMADNKTEDCFLDISSKEYTSQLMIEFDVSYDTEVLASTRLQYKDASGASSYFASISSDIIWNEKKNAAPSIRRSPLFIAKPSLVMQRSQRPPSASAILTQSLSDTRLPTKRPKSGIISR